MPFKGHVCNQKRQGAACVKETLLALRADIIKCCKDVATTQDWLLNYAALLSQDQQNESSWLKKVTKSHYEVIKTIETNLRSLPVPKPRFSNRHSQGTSRSSSSSKLCVIEAERAKRESQ